MLDYSNSVPAPTATGRTILVALLLGVGGASCGLFGADEVAHVKTSAGDVRVKGEAADYAHAAETGEGLVEGDIVTTGTDGHVSLTFAGGNEISLNPDSSLVIRAAGATAAEIGAVLLGGTAQASSSGEGLLLSIGTPFGVAEIGAGEVSLEIGIASGIKVLVGEVVVEAEDGQKKILAGNTLTIGGLVVPIGATVDGLDVELGDADGIELAPLVINLLANNKQVQVKREGQNRWVTPKKRDTLAEGDAIRTRKAASTQIQLGESSDLIVAAGSEVQMGRVGTRGDSLHAEYALNAGTATIKMARHGKDVHEISAGKTSLEVEPGRTQADVDVTAGKKGRTKINVRLGKVILDDGTVITAGSAANVNNGKLEGKVRPVARTAVQLRPRASSVIHYSGNSIPPLAFDWKDGLKDGDETYAIEVAKDKDFEKMVFAENVTRSDFVYDRFSAGRYYWRVEVKGGWTRGTFELQKLVERDCAGCKRTNNIDDNGEKTVVYYQQKLPALTFRWKPVNGAAKYQVRVFADGEFDNPHIEQSTTETQLSVKTGRMKEGKYYWLVKSLDEGGGEVATGRMNSLEIAYDNAITDLSITTPRAGARVSGRSTTTAGEAQLGAKLSINGRTVRINAQGRFRQSVPLSRGSNQIVYRTIAKDGIERFYVRDIYRR